MKNALRRTWDARAYKKGVAVAEPAAIEPGQAAADVAGGASEAADSDRNLVLISKAIESKFWWSYAQMLFEVHSCIEKLSDWSEGCICHGWLHTLGLAEKARFATMQAKHGIKDGDGFNLKAWMSAQ